MEAAIIQASLYTNQSPIYSQRRNNPVRYGEQYYFRPI
jgi:hypothetical protein